MPHLLTRRLDEFTQIGIWQVAETEQELLDLLNWSVADMGELDSIKGARRLESLAARLILHRLTGSTTLWKIEKDAHSKPHFSEHPEWHCALSHSHGLAVAMLSNRPCGLDLQLYSHRMDHLAHKFVNEAERALIEQYTPDAHMGLYHFIWSAKEAMYKVHGRKALDFRAHMHVHGFQPTSTGLIQKNEVSIPCALQLGWVELADKRYCLATALQAEPSV
jgi:4'-phosphopantetheinyl transferase